MAKLPESYFQNLDTIGLAQDLLGKHLHTFIDGKHTSGIITEVEAYMGVVDAACHAFNGKYTNRTKVIYENGGVAYVYLNYGMHWMLNLVAGVKGMAECILVRGIEPVEGLDVMFERRGMDKRIGNLTAGPGRLTQALGITKELYGKPVTGEEIWLTDDQRPMPEPGKIEVVSGPRIGIAYAGEDMHKPYRFWIKENQFVSKAPKVKLETEPTVNLPKFVPSPEPRRSSKNSQK